MQRNCLYTNIVLNYNFVSLNVGVDLIEHFSFDNVLVYKLCKLLMNTFDFLEYICITHIVLNVFFKKCVGCFVICFYPLMHYFSFERSGKTF